MGRAGHRGERTFQEWLSRRTFAPWMIARMDEQHHPIARGDVARCPGSVAELGALIGDPVRAAILHHLGDGSRRPAGELAELAGASPQAASAHLARLLDGGLLAVERRGRHRFYRIASGDAAEAIEALATWIEGPRSKSHPCGLRDARLCYDHLAGRLGVAVCDALAGCGLLVLGPDGPALSADGRVWCARCRFDPVPRTRRPAVRLCLDWTERRHHLGGWLGAELARGMFAAGYLAMGPRRRSVEVTARGAAFLERELSLLPARDRSGRVRTGPLGP